MKKRKQPSMLKNIGYSLLEVMIVVAASVVISLMVYGVYRVAFASQKGLAESVAASQLTDAIVRSYDALPNFTTVSTQQVINDNILPQGFTSSGNVIYGPNGSAIAISSETLQGTPGRGFSLNYQNVNQKLCTDLAAGSLPMQRFISVMVGATEVAPNGVVDEAKVATACNSAPTNVKLVYERGGTGNIAALEQCTLPTPNPETRELACNPGYMGKITEKRSASCLGPYELPTWGPWIEESDTCAIICTVDPASPQTRNTTACPSTHLGEIVEQRVSTCPQVTGYPTWSDWSVKSNTCAPKCVAPGPKVEQSFTCAAGFTGSYVTTTTYKCPAATGAYVVDTTNTENKCVRTCQSQIPQPNPNPVWQPRTKPCGAGYAGNITYEEEGKITYTCESSTSTETPKASAWVSTNTFRNENSSACVALCKPDTVLEQWVATSGQCQAGYTGGKTWEKRQTRTSVCPAGASNPTTSAWGDTGQTRNMVDNCVKICTLPNPSTEAQYQTLNELQQFACPAGTYGPNPGIDEWRQNNQARTRTAYCPQYTGDYAWTGYGNWYTTSYSAWNRTANHCNGCPAAYRASQQRWERRNEGCPYRWSGENNVSYLLQEDYTVAFSCSGGSAGPASYTTNFSGWYDTGQRTDRYSTCNCPVTTSTQSGQQSCPAGRPKFCEGRRHRTVSTNCEGSVVGDTGWVNEGGVVCVTNSQVCP